LTHVAGERQAAVEFLRSFATEIAPRVEMLSYGVGLFNPTIPSMWDFNFVWVDSVARLNGARLIADADRLHAAAGAEHRQIIISPETIGRALARGLEGSGYLPRRHVLMVQRREADRQAAEHAVAELDVEEVVRFTERELRHAATELRTDQVVESKRVVSRAQARFFGVRKRRGVVSACDLYARGEIAQIEAVITDGRHRNRGYARAVVLHAATEARRAGARLVFLQAEEDDWPKELYAKLGFDTVGALTLFLRRPGTVTSARGRAQRS